MRFRVKTAVSFCCNNAPWWWSFPPRICSSWFGHIVAHISVHGLNAQMATKLLQTPLNRIVVNAAEEAEKIVRQPEMLYHTAAL